MLAAGWGSPSLWTTQSRLITSLRRPPAVRSYPFECEFVMNASKKGLRENILRAVVPWKRPNPYRVTRDHSHRPDTMPRLPTGPLTGKRINPAIRSNVSKEAPSRAAKCTS
jgi:hypothetical protein